MHGNMMFITFTRNVNHKWRWCLMLLPVHVSLGQASWIALVLGSSVVSQLNVWITVHMFWRYHDGCVFFSDMASCFSYKTPVKDNFFSYYNIRAKTKLYSSNALCLQCVFWLLCTTWLWCRGASLFTVMAENILFNCLWTLRYLQNVEIWTRRKKCVQYYLCQTFYLLIEQFPHFR